MVLFKENLTQWTPTRKDGTPNKNCMLIDCGRGKSTHLLSALSQEFVENAVQLLVTRFMPLNPSDLEEWMADPEQWVNLEDKENEQWEFEIRVRALACVFFPCSLSISSFSPAVNAF
jgi:hypothetical protein